MMISGHSKALCVARDNAFLYKLVNVMLNVFCCRSM